MRTHFLLLLLVGCSPVAHLQTTPRQATRQQATPQQAAPAQPKQKLEVVPVTTPPNAPSTPRPSNSTAVLAQSPPEQIAFLPLWSDSLTAVTAKTPKPLVIPNVNSIKDLAVDETGRAYVLGTLGELFAIDNGRVKILVGAPVERDEDGNVLFNPMVSQGHGLYSSSDGLFEIDSLPGATAPYFTTTHLSREGKPIRDNTSISLVGANNWAIHHSGDAVWLSIYNVVYPIFPNQDTWVPHAPNFHSDGSWIPLRIAGSPPAYVDGNGELRRYNGVRWETSPLQAPPGSTWVSWTVDTEACLWGVIEDQKTQALSIVYHDGMAWHRGSVPGLDRPSDVLPIDRQSAWIISDSVVAKFTGSKFIVTPYQLISVGRYVDRKGRLWLFGTQHARPPTDLFETVDWTVLLFTGQESK